MQPHPSERIIDTNKPTSTERAAPRRPLVRVYIHEPKVRTHLIDGLRKEL